MSAVKSRNSDSRFRSVAARNWLPFTPASSCAWSMLCASIKSFSKSK